MLRGTGIMFRRFMAMAVVSLMVIGFMIPTASADEHDLTIRVAQHATLGTILVGANDMTLYKFDKDAKDVSNCIDGCAVKWPPLLVNSAADLHVSTGIGGTVSTITRKDGKLQVTYDGMPLYYWVNDLVQGEVTGHGVNKFWWVVNPAAKTTVQVTKHPTMGEMMTGPDGMSLYVFTKDKIGVSNCTGTCLEKWPPLLITDGDPIAPAGLAGKLGIITRADGKRQVTFNGAPLYHWVLDAKAGDTTGHKVNKVWWVARPGQLLDTAGHWSETDVAAAVRAGWVQGLPNLTFNPNGQVTRAEFVKMLMTAFVKAQVAEGMSFNDPKGHWAAGYIEGAVTAGIIKPSEYKEGKFEPDRAVTREELAVMTVRALGLESMATLAAGNLTKFTDASTVSAAFQGHMGLAVEHKIINGYPDGTVRGTGTALRAEAVVVVFRALGQK